MSELVSLVVTVRPAEPVTVPGHLGQAAYAQLMRWLSDLDAGAAQRWHDANGPKPFTCSSLVGARRVKQNQRALTPERTCWLRFTALEPEIAALLLEIAAQPPEALDLDGVTLQVESLTTDPEQHAWAGVTTYEALAAPYLLAREQAPRRVRLELASPTAFRQNDMNVAIPLPDLLFGSLANRWNAFSPIAISPEVRRYAGECVALTSFRLRSGAVPMHGGTVQVGAVGRAGYVAVRYDRYWMGVLGLLADFAFYAGAGRMTTTGLGQARRTDG